MSDPAESASSPSKRSSSPRPQAVGADIRIRLLFLDRFDQHSFVRTTIIDCQPTCERGKSDQVISKDTSEGKSTRCEESSHLRNPSPLAPCKWAKSLRCLLEDFKGVALFQQFLKQEKQGTRSLDFYFACRGLKKKDNTDREKMLRLINCIYIKMVEKSKAISTEIKKVIEQKLSSNTGVDINIFDEAQKDAERYLTITVYSKFLKSDIYLDYLQSVIDENSVKTGCCAKHALLLERRMESNKTIPEIQASIELKENQTLNKVDNFVSCIKLPEPQFEDSMATIDPTKFYAILSEKLQRVEEEQRTKEKLNHRCQAIKGSQRHPLHLHQVTEENDDYILITHMARVFK